MKLYQLLYQMKNNDIAKVYFGDEEWYVTKSYGYVRYCNEKGGDIDETIKLTPSNINADYIIINK